MTAIALALSGGADSLLSLALLSQQYSSVFALHALFLPPTTEDKKRIGMMQAQCRALEVPFETIDVSDVFERRIIQPFIRAYKQGKTPNPCCLCNKDMKFGLLLEMAKKLGAAKLATGHYCQVKEISNGYGLFRGQDASKDQSYFLSLVPGHVLKDVLFPLGTWHKKDVLPALKRQGLEPVGTSESQEICFVPEDYRSFLSSRNISLSGPGPVITQEGSRIGTHNGLWRYTQGQRRGLGIAHPHPLYVLHKNISTNTLVVGSREQLLSHECTATRCNLLVSPKHWPEKILVQTRYRQDAQYANIRVQGETLHVHCIAPQEIPTPGQILTVYSPEGQVLAGGILA